MKVLHAKRNNATNITHAVLFCTFILSDSVLQLNYYVKTNERNTSDMDDLSKWDMVDVMKKWPEHKK